jgi:hypothetical protein
MLNRRFHRYGFTLVLLALMAQLGVGASVPKAEFGAMIAGFDAICHAGDDSSGIPNPPKHGTDCLICPLCIALHAPAIGLLSTGVTLAPRAVIVVARTELPPPATAPPSLWPPSNQPRAPPAVS